MCVCVQGDKRKRQKKSHTKKQVKQVQKKTFAGVDVEFKDTIPKSSAEPVVSDTSQTAASSASQQGYTESYAQGEPCSLSCDHVM